MLTIGKLAALADVRTDTLGVVSGCRKNGGNIAAGHGLPKAEVRRQHGHAVGELTSAETDELLYEGSAGTELLCSTRLHVVRGAGKHCG